MIVSLFNKLCLIFQKFILSQFAFFFCKLLIFQQRYIIYLMSTQKEDDSSSYSKLKSNNFQLKYESSQAEGECIILSISPARIIGWKFVLYILSNVLLLVPLLLTYWNDKYKRIFYMKFCEINEATHFYIINYDGQASISKKQEKQFMITENIRQQYTFFINRYMTYILDQNHVVRLSIYNPHDRIKSITNNGNKQTGLTESQSFNLKNTYGPGTMIIKKPTIIQLIMTELIRPLYIFLVFSVLFWTFAEQYYYFSATLFVVFLIGVIINLVQMVELSNKIFAMAFYEIKLNALRDGVIKQTSSLDIVPGDIVFLKSPIKIPFEGIILQGSALINECALTGESVPVVKKADRLDKIAKNPDAVDKSSFVFEGTTIIQVSNQKKMTIFQPYRQQYGIPVCVVRTNFVTTKGQLIRIILFPRQQQNSFQRQSVKFLFFLFCFSVTTYIILLILNIEYEKTYDIIIKFIDLILIAVPPALPVSMTFGIIYAVERLQKKNIFCISQNKVITGGIIEFCCFDKTGTLTEDYMDFYCVVPAYNAKFHTQVVNTQEMAQYMIQNSKTKPYYLPILNNMASNHSIIKIEETGALIGDPMEVKLFQFGKYMLNQNNLEQEAIFSFDSQRGHTGVIYRRFQFQSQLQRMSVVAKTCLNEQYQVYAKGSPEMMLTVMKKSSVPKNYNDILKQYASHGFRVLAIANKPISQEEMKTWERQKMEQELIFSGFEVFENKLKVQTKRAIEQLKAAELGCVMITGDNTLTGSNISYKCSISSKGKNMIIVDFVENRLNEELFIFHDYDNTKAFPQDKPIAESYIEDDIRASLLSKSRISYRKRSSIQRMSETEFEPLKDNKQEFMFNLTVKADQTDCHICLTGRAFNQLFSGSVKDITQIHRNFMEKVTVFARTKPNDKAKIVMVFQQMGKKTSMCGDGANDCGALKQADIGLSLSQAEASISAPFTSQVTNITSMVQLIKECRAGLATNFSLFNIMAIYSLIQYSSTIIQERYLQYPADFQFLYWDFCMNFLLILFIGYTATADKLSIQKPRNSLFSVTNLAQMMIMFAIQFAAQMVAIVIYQNVQSVHYAQFGGLDNARNEYAANDDFAHGAIQSNAQFVMVNNIYLASVLAYNISDPWRKQFYTNLPLMMVALLTFAYNTLLTFIPQLDWSQFQLNHIISDNLRFALYMGSMAFSLFMYINQKCIMEPISYKLIKKYPNLKWL